MDADRITRILDYIKRDALEPQASTHPFPTADPVDAEGLYGRIIKDGLEIPNLSRPTTKWSERGRRAQYMLLMARVLYHKYLTGRGTGDPEKRQELREILATSLHHDDPRWLDWEGSVTIRAMLSLRDEMRQTTGVSQSTFAELLRTLELDCGLSHKGFVSAAQKLHVFLRICGGGASVEQMMEEFGHSRPTVYMCFRDALHGLVKLAANVVDESIATEGLPDHLEDDPRFRPFANAYGAVGIAHIPIYLPERSTFKPLFRNRSGGIGQHVVGACDFNLNFTAIAPGYDGISSEREIFAHFHSFFPDCFEVGDGYYYLASSDHGYESWIEGLLAPYPDTNETGREDGRAKRAKVVSREELFNVRHAALRDTIRQAFDVLLNRFPILKNPPSRFPAPKCVVERQMDLVCALTAVHNFMNACGQDPRMMLSAEGGGRDGATVNDGGVSGEAYANEVKEEEETEAMRENRQRRDYLRSLQRARRDGIADAIWQQYLFDGSASM